MTFIYAYYSRHKSHGDRYTGQGVTMSHGHHRFDPGQAERLLGEERRVRWNPSVRLSKSGLKDGFTALDLGCGPGFWTAPMAEIIGDSGSVIALDVSQELLDFASNHNPSSRIRYVLGELPSINLNDSSVDFVWASFLLHEISDLAVLLKELLRVLKPGGILAALDWSTESKTGNGPPLDHRLSLSTLEQFLADAGFTNMQSDISDSDAWFITSERKPYQTVNI